MIWRYRPPKGWGTLAPGTLAIWLRTWNCARSRSEVSSRPSPLKVTRHTGRLDASNFSTTGGNVPGGSRRNWAMARLEMVVTAESGFVPGWKKTLMMLTPGRERDSMCSMPLPRVKKRSNLLVISCLLYTSDAADEEDSVDLGGRRIIKKKK